MPKCSAPTGKKRTRFTGAAGVYLDGKEAKLAPGSYSNVTLTEVHKICDAENVTTSEGLNPEQVRKVEKQKATRTDCYIFKVAALPVGS